MPTQTKPYSKARAQEKILKNDNKVCQYGHFVTMERTWLLLHVKALPQKQTGNKIDMLKIEQKIKASIQ